MTLVEARTRGVVTAVIDGAGQTTDVGLYVERASNPDAPEAVEWPEGWPSAVSAKFLRAQGIRIVRI